MLSYKEKNKPAMRFRPYYMDPPPPRVNERRYPNSENGNNHRQVRQEAKPPLKWEENIFRMRVANESKPAKIAGAIAGALKDGREIEVTAIGERALSILLLALVMAQRYTGENGMRMEVNFHELDLVNRGAQLFIKGYPLESGQ